MPNPPDSPPEETDARLFEVLDRYVESLHRADAPTRSQLLTRHPELRGLLECLNGLDSLVPPPPAQDWDATIEAAPTLVFGNGRGGEPAESRGPACRVFGKYELLGEIGRGGMGVVYRARQTDLDRPVALKMILASRLASDEDVRRLYAEARAAGGLRHPNIVGIHEVGEDEGQHYFAMDCVEGQSLADKLRHGPLEPDEAARLVAQVSRAVDYLHANNIVHRDLKPSNILLDGECRPYVTDFGLAKVFNSDSGGTQTGTIVGTPSYMAPEQAAGRPSAVSPRSDVYSLGAILYELLSGRPPFQRDNPLDTLVDVLEGEPTLLTKANPQTPGELEWICLRCLEKDPEKRYPSAAALAEDLERFLRDEPVEAQPSGLRQNLRRWARREPALVSHVAALGLAAGIIQAKYMYDGYDLPFHLRVMGLLGLWVAASFVFQRMLHHDRLARRARYLWSACDVLLLTTLLYVSAAPSPPEPGSAATPLGPVVVAYPLLIVASGLFFHVRLVWFTTVMAVLSYSVLVALRPGPDPIHYPVICAAVLGILGFIVAYQVHRVRMLSRYFEDRPIP